MAAIRSTPPRIRAAGTPARRRDQRSTKNALEASPHGDGVAISWEDKRVPPWS